uniref:Arb2 domain-containing protein n=1 Tax=Leptobrachium leishanense TaxID=445787 RepID=A0A8C5LRG6_9ANUR
MSNAPREAQLGTGAGRGHAVESVAMEGLMRFQVCLGISQSSEDFQYYFNEQGELRHMITKKPFVYNFHSNEYDRNHKRYQVLGDLITLHIYELLEKECNLQRIQFPVDASDEEPKSSFFMSKELLNMQTSLLVLLQDKGVIRAGQWGQKVIFHHSLEKGSQIPYIKTAIRDQMSVLVLNPNDNVLEMKEEPPMIVKKEDESETNDVVQTPAQKVTFIPKRWSSSPEEHTSYVWDHFISKSEAGHVVFIAHGYGGLVFLDLLCKKRVEVMKKVSAVAFIDSRHHTMHQARKDPEVQNWIHKNCRSWVVSFKPLDRSIGAMRKFDCPKVSAGTENYDLAPFNALQSIFRFLNRSLKSRRTLPLSSRTILTRSTTRKRPLV